MRQIHNSWRYNETGRPSRAKTHIALKQPTAISWINKLRLKHTLRQARKGWNIHHAKYHYVQETIKAWKREWQAQTQKIHEIIKQDQITHGAKQQAETLLKNLHGRPYAHGNKNTTLKAIIKIRNKYPLLDNALKLNLDDHATTSQIMLKFPPENEAPDNTLHEHICGTCSKSFSTQRGKTKRRRISLKCKKSHNNINKHANKNSTP